MNKEVNTNTNNNQTTVPGYNNCFTLGAKSKRDNGAIIKVPAFIDSDGYPAKLWGGKGGALSRYYALSYDRAKNILERYLNGSKRVRGDESLRVSLYLDNAMFGDLHIFVIDFDRFDENSGFFQSAKNLANKVTRSQGGGWHMYYGINKETAAPLFDSINLLASRAAKSFVRSTGNTTLDGANKVDFFCDALHFIYEWEPWDNTIGLTDKTQQLYTLIKDNFSLTRPLETGWHSREYKTAASHAPVVFQPKDENALLEHMNSAQREIFDDLKTISPDCTRQEWFCIGLNIWHVYGDDLGGDVFRFWSEPGHSYVPQGCAVTWENIIDRGPDTHLNNRRWDAILHENVPSAF